MVSFCWRSYLVISNHSNTFFDKLVFIFIKWILVRIITRFILLSIWWIHRRKSIIRIHYKNKVKKFCWKKSCLKRKRGVFCFIKRTKTFLLFFVESHFFNNTLSWWWNIERELNNIKFLVLLWIEYPFTKIRICSGEHILHTTISCQIHCSTTPSLNQSNNNNINKNKINPCVRILKGECFKPTPSKT